MNDDLQSVQIQDAVQSDREGVLIKLLVTTGASRSGFRGYDEWRKCIRITVKSQPRKGEANEEIVSMISGWFGLEESSVAIVSGLKERSKTVSVRGMDVERVLQVLTEMEEE